MFSSRGLFGEMFSSHGLFGETFSSHGLFGEMFSGALKGPEPPLTSPATPGEPAAPSYTTQSVAVPSALAKQIDTSPVRLTS